LIAELPLGGIAGFLRRCSGSEVFFSLQLKMEPHLLLQLTVEAISPRVEKQPAPEL
jgi:hypothetical protein